MYDKEDKAATALAILLALVSSLASTSGTDSSINPLFDFLFDFFDLASWSELSVPGAAEIFMVEQALSSTSGERMTREHRR